jgi:hypothetical protein
MQKIVTSDELGNILVEKHGVERVLILGCAKV